jgi:DNA-binding XRE family transcriptional regulator
VIQESIYSHGGYPPSRARHFRLYDLSTRRPQKPHPTPGTLGERLRKIRRCRGLTSRQAARLANVQHYTFLMWESGKWAPTLLTRARLDRILERFERDLPGDCSTVAC